MRLLIKHLGKTVYESELADGREFFAGRQEGCDFVFEDGQGLSRKHIRIFQSEESGNWVIESLSEAGGLFLEGEPAGRTEIDRPLSFTLKSYVFEFALKEEEKEEEPAGGLPPPAETAESEEEAAPPDGATKVLADTHLVYSLSVSIEGDSSELVDLNEGDSWSIGRSKDCDVFIEYKFLSRRHMKITRSGAKFYVTDLGNANGTVLNDRELKANRPHPLNSEDRISVGDLNMVFEARNRRFESMMKNLPAAAFEESGKDQPPAAAMAFPKVILEDAPADGEDEDEAGDGKKKSPLSVKRIIMLGAAAAAVLGGVYFTDKKKKDEKIEMDKKAESAEKARRQGLYNTALQMLNQEKFQFCIDELNKLHSKIPSWEDSQNMLKKCQHGKEAKEALEEAALLREKKREHEEKVKKMAAECSEKAASFETVADLMACAGELLQLDPENAVIHGIKRSIEDREIQQRLEAEKKESFRKKIQSKLRLLRRARKIRDQNMPLKAVAAYDVFLKSARGMASLRKSYEEAQAERDAIQENYDSSLSRLYEDCESLVNAKKMREAYNECQNILKFRKKDQKAVRWMELAKKTLRDELKPLYQESAEHESWGRIPQAKKLWAQIVERDIKEGYYYKKARHLLNKHK